MQYKIFDVLFVHKEVAKQQPHKYSEFVLVPGLLVGGFAVKIEPKVAFFLLFLHI